MTGLRIGPSHIVGHSLGGAVAIASGQDNEDISDVVSMNPLFPINYNLVGFGLRALYKGTREIWGISGERSSRGFGLIISFPFLVNAARDPISTYKTIRSICRYQYKDVKIRNPVLILYGTSDEYFSLDQRLIRPNP
ncbi:MAG TPA: hypothetical protein VFF28_07985 [Candidatus Nanoarchaeia archaeon]|nr:hypothetical protein [Candidatus Nanoarchaeia archaeon]